MAGLGWQILNGGEFSITKVPRLSEAEEKLLLAVRKEFQEHAGADDAGADVRRRIAATVRSVADAQRLQLGEDQVAYLAEVACLDARGFGVLSLLLDEPMLEEIAVIGVGKPVYVFHRERGWMGTNAMITSGEYLVHLINRMARGLGRRITWQSPRLNATLPNGARLHASIPPVSDGEITIRKFRENPIHAGDLVAGKAFSAESLAFLWLLLQGDLSTLIAGNTASGKTSTLNALMAFIRLDERLLITEETPELNLPHPHKVKMVANEEAGIGMGNLVADALRMRPDRVIVGEVRTPGEAKALFETILAGQARGAFATFHAGSAGEAVTRLKGLGIAEMDLESLDLVIVQRRILRWDEGERREVRRCMEISELQGAKPVQLFAYDWKTDSLKRTDAHSGLERKMQVAMGLSEAEWNAQVKARAEFLGKMAGQKLRFPEVVRRIQMYTAGAQVAR